MNRRMAIRIARKHERERKSSTYRLEVLSRKAARYHALHPPAPPTRAPRWQEWFEFASDILRGEHLRTPPTL